MRPTTNARLILISSPNPIMKDCQSLLLPLRPCLDGFPALAKLLGLFLYLFGPPYGYGTVRRAPHFERASAWIHQGLLAVSALHSGTQKIAICIPEIAIGGKALRPNYRLGRHTPARSAIAACRSASVTSIQCKVHFDTGARTAVTHGREHVRHLLALLLARAFVQ